MLKKLSGLDAGFLYLETGRSFGHVSSLLLFDRPADPDFDLVAEYRSRAERALPVLEPLRRRLVEVPFGLDHPYWVLDPHFDLDYHVRHIAVPPPGGPDELCALVARIIGRPLDRNRPLWETYLIEGVDDGSGAADGFAVLTKVHHATIDGVGGAQMLMMLLDHPESEGEPPGLDADLLAAPLPAPDTVPGPAEMLGRAWWDLVSRPDLLVRAASRTMREVPRIIHTEQFDVSTRELRRRLPGPLGPALSRAIGADHPRRPAAGEADEHHDDGGMPRTRFNAHITANRSFTFRSVPFAAVRDLKRALGVTVNDTIMAACAGALRRYLEGHDDLPEQPLRAMVPVSIRTFTEDDPWTNRVSSIFVHLPTDIADPAERVAAVHAAMDDAKHRFELLPAELIIDLASAVPGALSVQAARLATNPRIADRSVLPSNVVISNVPGPREPLYLGPARLTHYIPVSTVIDGQGLNITVQSYDDVVDFGFVGCRELVPDIEDLADLHLAEIDTLRAAVDLAPISEGVFP